MSFQSQQTCTGDNVSPLQKKEMMTESAGSPSALTESTQREELEEQVSEPEDKDLRDRQRRKLHPTWLKILSVVLNIIVTGLIISFVPGGVSEGDIAQLILLGGTFFVGLSLLLLVMLSYESVPFTARVFIYSLSVVGILLLGVRLGMAIHLSQLPPVLVEGLTPPLVESPGPTTEGSPTLTATEVLPPVLVFKIETPRELGSGDTFAEVSGILQLGADAENRSLDVKVYVKPKSETWWQLSDLKLKCAAMIRNGSWRIEPDCVTFGSEYDSFTLVAVLVDDSSPVFNLPGSIGSHRIEAAEFADLKKKLMPLVYGKGEFSISEPHEVPRALITATEALPPEVIAKEPSPTYTPEPTVTRSPTATATPIPLLPAVVIDDKETQQERRADGKDSYRLLRWKEWTENAPEGWYYVVRFLPANNVDLVFHTVIVPPEATKRDNEGWLTYSFDILSLPRDEMSCYPYWDVIVAIDAKDVNCPPEGRVWQGICRLTEFSSFQQALATAPPGVCPGPGGNEGSRPGSTQDPGHLPPDL